jgi:diguanylate cyclase (GGDEF)-like protein/PAS domain S-box-containing protein
VADAGAGELPEASFRSIVDQTGNPFVVIGPDGVIKYAGGSITEVLGWTPDALVGRNIVELLPPDQIPIAIEGISEVDTVNRGAEGVPMVFEVIRDDGSTTSVEIGALPILDLPGGDGIALRLRPWDAQRHFDEFLAAMLDGEPLDVLLTPLAHSIALSLVAAGVGIHHGFDGRAFAASPGWGVPEACLADGSFLRQDEPACYDVDELPPAVAAAARDAGLQACWTMPVPASAGLAPAVVSVWRSVPGPALIGHRHVLGRSTRFVQLALVRTAEYQRLEHLAGHDPLTGVANRTEFRDRLAAALAVGERDLAVAFCDLDGFKPVNDTFGHQAGDAVLVEMADRLRRRLRTGDELARVGGDEFTVLLRNVPDAAAATHVGERLLAAAADPFVVPSGVGVNVGLSVGVAMWEPGSSADDLLARADEALYEAKRSGRGIARVSG